MIAWLLALQAAGSYVEVQYPPSTSPGELVFGVTYTLWIPPTKAPLRGFSGSVDLWSRALGRLGSKKPDVLAQARLALGRTSRCQETETYREAGMGSKVIAWKDLTLSDYGD